MGDLNSTEVDYCTLHFTWTAPYTPQGVPINYYNITITGHSDGAVLGSYTTNTTEFLYSVGRLGEALEVVVAAMNDVGTGNSGNITVQCLFSSKLLLMQAHYENLSVHITVSCILFQLGHHLVVRSGNMQLDIYI